MKRSFCSFVFLLLSVASAWAGAGRVEIHQRHMATPPFLIDLPGAYIVTSPLVVTQENVNAIRVQANHVSIDLNGFTITGPGDSAHAAAIHQDAEFSYLHVRDGNIVQWGGDASARAVNAPGADNRFEDITIVQCRDGITTGSRSQIIGCVLYSNSLSFASVAGLHAGSGSTVTRSSALRLGAISDISGFHLLEASHLTDAIAYRISGTLGSYGIRTGARTATSDSLARRISSGDGTAYGIHAASDARFRRVTSTEVAALNVGEQSIGIRIEDRGELAYAVAQRATDGIHLENDAAAYASLMISNTASGVRMQDRNRVSDSLAVANAGEAFVLAGQKSAATDNIAAGNHTGFITASGGSNLVARNTSIADTISYSFGSATRSGQLSGNPGAGFTVTNAWANFSISP